MRNSWIILLVIMVILLFALGVMMGIYFYGSDNTEDTNLLNMQLVEESISENNVTVSTSLTEEKVSPNCTIVEKQYFTGCDHLIKDIKEIPEDWINMTEEEIIEKYPDWTLESFTNNQIIVSQEKEGYCGEHYVIRTHDDVIGIYTLDENGKETLKEDTDIPTMYLTEEDLEILNKGIQAIGENQLHQILEDYE